MLPGQQGGDTRESGAQTALKDATPSDVYGAAAPVALSSQQPQRETSFAADLATEGTRRVKLERRGTFGFTVLSVDNKFVVIKDVLPGGPAESSGMISPRDRIVEVCLLPTAGSAGQTPPF
jgi:C-terminal processing protease CtpA/Prc